MRFRKQIHGGERQIADSEIHTADSSGFGKDERESDGKVCNGACAGYNKIGPVRTYAAVKTNICAERINGYLFDSGMQKKRRENVSGLVKCCGRQRQKSINRRVKRYQRRQRGDG